LLPYVIITACSAANPLACVESVGDLGGGDSTGNNVFLASIVSHEKDTLRHNEIMANFKSKIAVKGWKMRGETPKDGNCFFWSEATARLTVS
jgi:hypothetical protein